jgi:hypothetical protein
MSGRVLLMSLLVAATWNAILAAHERPRLRFIRTVAEERILAGLEDRCRKMQKIQTVIYDRTKRLHKVVQTRSDKTPRLRDKNAALKLSRKVNPLIKELHEAIDILEGEGTAVAFPEVFREVLKDVKLVQQRLQTGDVGPRTQAIEEDIIDTFREMTQALTKTRY